jgi:hypothetical protein
MDWKLGFTAPPFPKEQCREVAPGTPSIYYKSLDRKKEI